MSESERFNVVSSEQVDDGTTVEILEYGDLRGAADVRAAENLYFARQSGMTLKMVRIRLTFLINLFLNFNKERVSHRPHRCR